MYYNFTDEHLAKFMQGEVRPVLWKGRLKYEKSNFDSSADVLIVVSITSFLTLADHGTLEDLASLVIHFEDRASPTIS